MIESSVQSDSVNLPIFLSQADKVENIHHNHHHDHSHNHHDHNHNHNHDHHHDHNHGIHTSLFSLAEQVVSRSATSDADKIIKNIIGKKSKVPFSAKTEEYQELLQTVEITLAGIYPNGYDSAEVAEYILSKYITARSAKKIKKDLGLDIIDLSPQQEALTRDLINTTKTKEIPLKIQKLLAIPQPEQKSQAWLDQRQSFITASVFGEACGMKGPAAMVSLLLDKISYGKYAPFSGNRATQWGEKYENIANAIYAYRNKCDMYEFGMIPHPVHYFLGASTDGISSAKPTPERALLGISSELINIEIKCPFSRIITGVTPKAYWAQTQLQMNVLDLDTTHFLECRFIEYPSFEAFFCDFEWYEEDKEAPLEGAQISFRDPPATGHHLEKGLMFEVIDHKQTNLRGHPKTIYMHSPVALYRDKTGLMDWYHTTLKSILTSENLIYVRVIPWHLSRLSCVEIKRDKEWFAHQIPKVTEFWKDVEYYRKQNLRIDEIASLKEMLLQKYGQILGKSPRSSPKSSPTKNKGIIFESDEPSDLPSQMGCILDDDEEESTSVKPVLENKPPAPKGGCMLDDNEDDFVKPNKPLQSIKKIKKL